VVIFNYETLIDFLIRDIGKFTHGFAGMKAGDGVIDICSGTGTRVLEYARNSIIAVGIDSSLDMLKTAKRNKVR
jgi:ubiquinone/menaquinone biosynthesis C-methylase UbiE